MKTYQQRKAEARKKAIFWQMHYEMLVYFQTDLNDFSDYFWKIGKRYGLLREFTENGII